jgi:hypothetical protein
MFMRKYESILQPLILLHYYNKTAMENMSYLPQLNQVREIIRHPPSLETFYILQNGIKLCKIQKYMIKSLTGYKDSLKAFVIVHVYKDINFP